MFTCNVMFSRTVRKSHRKKKIETRCIPGCVVNQDWEGDGPTIRAELMRHAPPGTGWMVGGYARVETSERSEMNDTAQTPYQVTCSPWKVFEMNEYEWWVARSLEEAIADHHKQTGCDPSEVADAHELSDADMDRLKFIDEGHDLRDPRQWRCDCGAIGDGLCRYVDGHYEHNHGYPVGHVAMTCTTKRSFLDQLKKRINEGLTAPEFFAGTES